MKSPIGSDGFVVRDSGIWAKEKLYYLEHYLDIFSVGMRGKWGGKLYYVDLFAGSGRCLIRETGEEVDGSPLIALKFNFARYFFFEADPDCFEALKQRIQVRAPEKDVTLINGNCNELIGEVQPSRHSLGLAFIDPTGVSPLAFATIRKLTSNRRIDLIINFHEGMGVRMNIHQYTQAPHTALDMFVGSGRWRHRLEKEPLSFDQLCEIIAREHRENLESLGYLAFDADRVPIKMERDVLLYYLLFASKDRKGTEFWHKIGLIGPHGQRRLGF